MSGIPEKVMQVNMNLSPYPASFAGNPALYAGSLATLMSIGLFGLVIARWMIRDLWRDRFTSHPKSLLFAFRLMMFLAGSAAFLRCAPEVVYLTCFNDPDISADTMATILAVKRVADVLALPVVVGWMTVLVLIYPFVVIALRSFPAGDVRLDPIAYWPRLIRPVAILGIVIMIAVLMAVAKGMGIR